VGAVDWLGIRSNLSTHFFESRKSDAVEMDEMMAAMVLTSLSCSPVVQSPPRVEASFSGEQGLLNGFQARQRPVRDISALSS
jgi:hypothetical protein